jgi:phosphoribosylglycinamide formyltransferase-1
VHFVSEENHSGPIVAQAAVAVLESDTADTLSDRILVAEHKLYPHALALVTSGRVKAEANRVTLTATEDRDGQLFSPQLRR